MVCAVRFAIRWMRNVRASALFIRSLTCCPTVPWLKTFLSVREPTKRGLINYEEMRRNTQRLLSELEVDDWISPDMLVRHLSVAGQQMVEIAKALSFESRVLIMDEPTAALAPHEVEVLFRLVRRLQQRGLGIVYISHRFKEIFELADRITVLKDGKKVATVEKAAVTSADIIEMMVGRPLEEFIPTTPSRTRSVRSFSASSTAAISVCEISTWSCGQGRSLVWQACKAPGRPISCERYSAVSHFKQERWNWPASRCACGGPGRRFGAEWPFCRKIAKKKACS